MRGPIRIGRASFRSGLKLGVVMFCGDYGCIFPGEQRVPSGIAALTGTLVALPRVSAVSGELHQAHWAEWVVT